MCASFKGKQLTEDKGPRYYFINPKAGRWSIRTGRPAFEWLWNDDLETREDDEIA